MVIEATLCHIINNGKLALKKASRGLSKGKWNAPGGKIEGGETPEENAIREVLEETGLKVRDLFHHGTIRFFLNGTDKLHVRSNLFSAKKISGELKSTDEGEVKWFDFDKIPFDKMWADDKYWIHLMLAEKRFDADFYLDKRNEKVVKYEIRLK